MKLQFKKVAVPLAIVLVVVSLGLVRSARLRELAAAPTIQDEESATSVVVTTAREGCAFR